MLFRHLLRNPDAWLGLAVIAFGVWFAAMATEFSGRGRHFPLWLSVTVALCGLGILAGALHAAWREGPGPAPGLPVASLLPILTGAVPFALVVVGWVLALSYGLGYVLPGIVAGSLLLIIAGERRPLRILLLSSAIIITCYLIFSVIFNVRLPELAVINDLIRPLRRLIH